MSHPLASKISPFRRAKMVVKCASVGQLTDQRTIGELLLLIETSQTKSHVAISDIPKTFLKLRPWIHQHSFDSYKGINSTVSSGYVRQLHQFFEEFCNVPAIYLIMIAAILILHSSRTAFSQ